MEKLENYQPTEKEINETYEKLKAEVEKRGYFLNPDVVFTKNLIKGLLINQKRYGYWACPCRLASGNKEKDLDIICPCDYRDQDIVEFGCCYCSLYVSEENSKSGKFKPIPDRRNSKSKMVEGGKMEQNQKQTNKSKLPVWRCKVCGYLCARENAPDKCPICGAEHDRFEIFEQ